MLDFAATPKTADPGAWKCDWIKDPFNRLTSSTKSGQTTTYQYDGRGNQVRKTEGTAVTAYTYDSRNVMTEVALSGGQANRYGYDPQGLRVAMEDGEGIRRIVLDGVEEYGDYDTSSGMQVARYDHDPSSVDGLLGQLTSQGKHHFNTDTLGSVYGMTGSGGSLASSYSYDVYGRRTTIAAAAVSSWSFTGRRIDSSSGLLYARARYLSTETGAFQAVDPLWSPLARAFPKLDILSDVALIQPYLYVGGRPTFFRDPHGLFPTTLIDCGPGIILEYFKALAFIYQAIVNGPPIGCQTTRCFYPGGWTRLDLRMLLAYMVTELDTIVCSEKGFNSGPGPVYKRLCGAAHRDYPTAIFVGMDCEGTHSSCPSGRIAHESTHHLLRIYGEQEHTYPMTTIGGCICND